MTPIEELDFEIKNPRPCYVWATTIKNSDDVNSRILKTISEEREKNPTGYTDDININVWQSNWEMENQPGFKDVADSAKEISTEIAKNHYNFKQFNPRLVDCWCNVYNKNSGCKVHQHFPATFSLVYYVKVPENSGRIFFPDLDVQLDPKPGLLLCFRGDTWHGVEFNQTEKDRIIIGMNVIYSFHENQDN